ncbi:heme NO-binding domain-containing protein [Alloalcanivorax mobilis]|uniref:heme NO-binding domain-containing protein n=1 Tax=Alloalcanivorax mobilis TaxID=2019569 RepID=UPI000C75F8D2|nr:heme NO-binding domain-containing protein [Alloalcanivorax mobilis]
MHGVLLHHLRPFVSERFGARVWESVQVRAGQPGKMHTPVHNYADEELEQLLLAMTGEIGLCRDDLLQAFGHWLIGPLINMYRAMIPRQWDARTFLLHVEEHIHQKVVRLRDPRARPPRIDVTALSADTLEIDYHSHRDLSALALGCVYGVADYFGERVELLSSASGEEGGRRFVVRLQNAAPPGGEGAAAERQP